MMAETCAENGSGPDQQKLSWDGHHRAKEHLGGPKPTGEALWEKLLQRTECKLVSFGRDRMTLFRRDLPFPDVFYGLSLSWTCEIDPIDMWKPTSGVSVQCFNDEISAEQLIFMSLILFVYFVSETETFSELQRDIQLLPSSEVCSRPPKSRPAVNIWSWAEATWFIYTSLKPVRDTNKRLDGGRPRFFVCLPLGVRMSDGASRHRRIKQHRSGFSRFFITTDRTFL